MVNVDLRTSLAVVMMSRSGSDPGVNATAPRLVVSVEEAPAKVPDTSVLTNVTGSQATKTTAKATSETTDMVGKTPSDRRDARGAGSVSAPGSRNGPVETAAVPGLPRVEADVFCAAAHELEHSADTGLRILAEMLEEAVARPLIANTDASTVGSGDLPAADRGSEAAASQSSPRRSLGAGGALGRRAGRPGMGGQRGRVVTLYPAAPEMDNTTQDEDA